MNKISITISLITITALSACSINNTQTTDNSVQTTTQNSKAEIQTLWIAPQKASCTGVAPMQCLLVQKAINNNQPDESQWQYFYDDIQGFNWKQGQLNKITIKVSKLNPKDVPMDASSLQYELIKVLQ